MPSKNVMHIFFRIMIYFSKQCWNRCTSILWYNMG